MSNLAQRLITGSIFVVVLVGCIWFSPWTLSLLCLTVTILGLYEFYKLSLISGAEPQKQYGVIAGGLIVILSLLSIGTGVIEFGVLIVPIFFLIFFIELYRKKKNPFSNIGWTIAGLIYIAVPMALLIWCFAPSGFLLHYIPGRTDGVPFYDFTTPLLVFILIWVSDSMAYVCGRLFGRHKLWERISPKKTWEGFIGGAIFTVLVAGITIHVIDDAPNSWFREIRWMCIALVISVSGMLGDLVESLLKRSVDVKDSGTLLPGHGGILDRFDALFLATPFVVTAFWVTDRLQEAFLS